MTARHARRSLARFPEGRPRLEPLESRTLLSALTNTGLYFTSRYDINPVFKDTYVAGNDIFFRAQDSDYNSYIAKISGSPPASTDSGFGIDPTPLVSFNGEILFGTGNQLWKSDGTPQGTVKIVDLGGSLADFTVVGPYTYFVAGYFPTPPSGTSNGVQPDYVFSVYRTDGTSAGTVKLADYDQTWAGEITDLNGTAFWATSNGISKSDGTPAGTVDVVDTRMPSIFAGEYFYSTPDNLTAVGNSLYFSAATQNGAALWRTDGTVGNATIQAVFPDTGSPEEPQPSDLTHFAAVGNTLVFQVMTTVPYAGGGYTNRFDLYGTNAAGQTYLLKAMPHAQVTGAAMLDGILYLTVPGNGVDTLLRTDGTLAGTKAVYEFVAPPSPGEVGDFYGLVTWNGHLVFYRRYLTSNELWTSDGTVGGTAFFTTLDIPNSSFIEAFAGDTLLLRVIPSQGRDQAWTYALPPPPPQQPVTGWVDSANALSIGGWAADPSNPADALSIRFNIDGKDYATISAGQTRSDLTAFSHKNHGFTYQIPALAAGDHVVKIFATNPRTGRSLFLGTKNILVSSMAPQGFLDSADSTHVAGWAVDRNTPTLAVKVAVKVDGSFLPNSFAFNVRNELTAVFGSANHGFNLALPHLASGSHRIDLYAADTLTGKLTLFATRSLKVVSPAPSRIASGFVDQLTPTSVSGWAFSANKPDTAVLIRCVIDRATVIFIYAGNNRPDLLAHLGHPYHGFAYALPKLKPGAHTISLAAYSPGSNLVTDLVTKSFIIP